MAYLECKIWDCRRYATPGTHFCAGHSLQSAQALSASTTLHSHTKIYSFTEFHRYAVTKIVEAFTVHGFNPGVADLRLNVAVLSTLPWELPIIDIDLPQHEDHRLFIFVGELEPHANIWRPGSLWVFGNVSRRIHRLNLPAVHEQFRLWQLYQYALNLHRDRALYLLYYTKPLPQHPEVNQQPPGNPHNHEQVNLNQQGQGNQHNHGVNQHHQQGQENQHNHPPFNLNDPTVNLNLNLPLQVNVEDHQQEEEEDNDNLFDEDEGDGDSFFDEYEDDDENDDDDEGDDDEDGGDCYVHVANGKRKPVNTGLQGTK